jgi:plasmid stability protein
MARARKAVGWATGRSRQAQLKIRLPEPLRLSLEIAARQSGRSLNAEAVARLSESVLGNKDPDALAAAAILNGLDQRIVTIIEDMILRANAEKEVREIYRSAAGTEDEFMAARRRARPGDPKLVPGNLKSRQPVPDEKPGLSVSSALAAGELVEALGRPLTDNELDAAMEQPDSKLGRLLRERLAARLSGRLRHANQEPELPIHDPRRRHRG